MKQLITRKSFSLIATICVLLSLLSGSTALASETGTAESNQHIYDKADLLSTSEIEDLEKMCTEYGDEAGIEIMILTHDDPDAVYAEDYIENFEDNLPVGDRVYILLDMQNRDVFMEGYGLAETYIHSKRIATIIDEITPSLSNGDYYDAFATYIERSAAYMSDDSELNYDHDYTASKPQSNDPSASNYDETWPAEYNSGNNAVDSILTNVWFQLLAAVIIGIIVVAIMAYNSGGKMTTGGNTYMDSGNSGLIGRRDDYVRTQVTRVRKPQNNNNNQGGGFNAGGFRGGSSGGGRSHSSGGGKF
jgi:uncharacterized protein